MGALLLITFIGFSTIIVVLVNISWKQNELEKRIEYIEDLIEKEMRDSDRT